MGKRFNILIVEDKVSDANFLKEMLTDSFALPHTIEHVFTLRSAELTLKNKEVDLILLDLDLPDSSGYMTFLKINNFSGSIPIIALNDALDDELGKKLIRSGAQDYLTKKNLDIFQLSRSLNYAIERNNSFRKLKESDENSKIIINDNVDGLLIVNRQGVVKFVNPAACDMFNISKNDFVGREFGYPLVQGDASEIEILKENKPSTIVEMRKTEIDWHGEQVYMASLRDITKLKERERQIQESEIKYHSLFDNNLNGIALLKGRVIVDFNEAVEKMLGYKKEELINKSPREISPEYQEDGRLSDEIFDELFQKVSTKENFIIEWKLITKSNETIFTEISANPIEIGGEFYIQTMIRNITEKKIAERKLMHLNSILDAIRKINRLIVYEKDIDKLIQKACDNLVSSRGYENAWIITFDEKKKIKETAQTGLGDYFEEFIQYYNDGKIINCIECLNKEDDYCVIEDTHLNCGDCPLKDTYSNRKGLAVNLKFQGYYYGIMIVSLSSLYGEIEEEKSLLLEVARDLASAMHNINQEKIAKENERKILFQAKMLDTVGQAVIATDIKGNIIYWNKAAEKIYGWSENEVIGENILEVTPTDMNRAQAEDLMETLSRGGNWSGEFFVKDKYGREFPAIVSDTPIFDDNENLIGVIGITTDITELHKKELELKKSNRAYRMLSECNKILVKAENEEQLLNKVCYVIVQIGGYKLAWVGFKKFDDEKTIEPAAKAGYNIGYLDDINVTWANELSGKGPTGTAIRTKQTVTCQNIQEDPKYKPWRKEALKRGFSSSAALPLINEDEIVGVLNIYSEEPYAFNKYELEILQELSHDLAFGIAAQRNKVRLEQTLEELKEAEQFTQSTIDALSKHIAVVDETGTIVAVNQSWRDFAEDNNVYDIDEVCEGANYFEECKKATGEDKVYAEKLLDGVAKVLNGEISLFSMDYPCHSPEERRWFTVKVTKFKGNGSPRLVISHLNITELKLTEEYLKESEERYRTIFENSTLGIYRSTPEGRLLMANQALIDMLKYDSFEELQSLDIEREIYQNENSREELKKLLNTDGVAFGFERTVVRKDGESIYIRVNAKAFNDQYGALSYYEGIVEDITEEKLYEEELKTAKEKAEKSDKLKSQFLAQMSHEIRTPLNVITNFARLLKDEVEDKVEDEIAETFVMIEHASQRIIRTIDLIINVSEMQVGTYEPSFGNVELDKDILRVIVNENSSFAETKGLALILKVKTDKTEITGDFYSIYQIFSNLVDNAIKYTPEGHIKIEVDNLGENGIIVSVSDTGIGIAEDYLPNLFKPFSQEEQGYTRKYEGSGLGLSLVKQYCDINDAEIRVQSEKGKGSVFSVMFQNNKNQTDEKDKPNPGQTRSSRG